MRKILIVEDNNEIRKKIKDILINRLPLTRIFEAADTETAEDIFTNDHPDVIITDLRLPGNGGLWLTEQIKLSHPQMPIIINSNFDTVEYRVAAFQLGADFFLSKRTNSLNDVVEIIRSVTPL